MFIRETIIVSDEVLEGLQKLQELKPDHNKANPRIGVGALAFSSDSRYMYTRNGTSLLTAGYFYIFFYSIWTYVIAIVMNNVRYLF